MHTDNQVAVQNFLIETRKISDPIERLQALESSEFSEDAAIKAAKAWWAARYSFADKKKTRAQDKFLWFLLTLKSCVNNNMTMRSRPVVKTYEEAFLSAETNAAIALDNRLEEEVLSACVLYLSTIELNPGFFGFKSGKSLSQDETLMRMALIVGDQLMAGVYTTCRELPHADLIIRCLYKGAEQLYPGVSAKIEAMLRDSNNEQICDFIKRAIGMS